MPHTVLRFLPTPNPNAVKCILDRPVPGVSRSYRSLAEAPDAAADALGASLLRIPGVSGVLIHGDWVTVNKDPVAPWAPIKAGVSAALAALR